jgi:photosystem II stability/assembly factor-like uncharacterized protein
VLRTDDGGASWHETLIDADINAPGASIAFADAEHGIAVTADVRPFQPRSSVGVTYATSDGGVSWAKTAHPPPVDGLADVDIVR